MTIDLQKYYLTKKTLIDSAIQSLSPEECTSDWMFSITGRKESSWDLPMLSQTFREPIKKHIAEKEKHLGVLGTILFLESGGLDPSKFIALLAVSEELEGSFQIFRDIYKDIESKKEILTGLNPDKAILANVGVALITLPYFSVILDNYSMKASARLWLFSRMNSSLSRALYANAIHLFRTSKEIKYHSVEEFCMLAHYKHSLRLQYHFDLWLALSGRFTQNNSVDKTEKIVQKFCIALQWAKEKEILSDWAKQIREAAVSFRSEVPDLIMGLPFRQNSHQNIVNYINHLVTHEN